MAANARRRERQSNRDILPTTMHQLLKKVTRTKTLEDATSSTSTSLKRCLGTADLTLMGVGGMVGSGIYVLVGIAAKELAGPGIVLAFLLASATVVLAALCFAEFASRISRTGSTYLYTYFTLGEMVAFLVGWSTVVLSMLGGATNARAWSAYMDSLLDGSIVNLTETYIGVFTVGAPIAARPDFVAVAAMFTTTIVVALGANCSAKFNGIFAVLNVCVLLFATVVGFIYADTSNWTSPKHGGFLPYGWSGVLAGATPCFWAFSGFEIIAVSAEEARDPRKSILRALLGSLAIVTLLYVGTASALTLVTNYTDIDAEAPLPSAFQARGLTWARYILSVGPLCGLTTTLLSSQFTLVRIVYAIANDGLLFPVFARVNSCTKVPLAAVFVGGAMTCVCAFCLDLRDLLGIAVVLNLLQYILVSASVILLRYQQQQPSKPAEQYPPSQDNIKKYKAKKSKLFGIDNVAGNLTDEDGEHIDRVEEPGTQFPQTYIREGDNATPRTSKKVPIRPFFHCLRPFCRCNLRRFLPLLLFALFCLMVALAALGVYGHVLPGTGQLWALGLVLGVIVLIVGAIAIFQQNTHGLIVKVPCVPVVPVLSMMSAILLIVSTATKSAWIGTVIVFIIGLVLYFGYGIRHSKENVKPTLVAMDTSTVSLLRREESGEESDEI